MIIALASILSIILLIGSQKYLYNVILTTYQVSSKYKKAHRIQNNKLTKPIIPNGTIHSSNINNNLTNRILKSSTTRRICNSKLLPSIYKTKNIQPEEVNMENLKTILGSIPLESESHYYFIIPPGDKTYMYQTHQEASVTLY